VVVALVSNVGGVVVVVVVVVLPVVAGKITGVYEDERDEAKSAVDFGLGWEDGRMGRDGRECFSLCERGWGCLGFEI
jgi:hypothetical protein